jgi:ABC-type lipoprotein release transport system permease subunit
VRQNLRRNRRLLMLSGLGIVIGIAAFVFFLGLSGGVRKVVLGDIFPINRVEVIAPRTTLTGIPAPVDDALVAKLRARPEVAAAYPRMRLSFPAEGNATIPGVKDSLYFPIGGFCDGVDPALLTDDPAAPRFKDWEVELAGKMVACAPDGSCADSDFSCWAEDNLCHHRVPVIVSRHILELYNGSFAPAHGLKRLGGLEEGLLSALLDRVKFRIDLGKSAIKTLNVHLARPPSSYEAQLVGLSTRAMQLGVTVPMGYVKRWNERYIGKESTTQYSSIVVDLRDKDDVASFVGYVERLGYTQEESYAQNLAVVINIVTLLFVVISLVIIGMSATNIAHTFFMLVSDRRREIGIMRAVGATRADVRRIILGEAACVGLIAGGIGIGIGIGVAKILDLVNRYTPTYPFKPKTFFHFSPALLLGALGFAVLFCVLGAYLPARRAANLPPAKALTS